MAWCLLCIFIEFAHLYFMLYVVYVWFCVEVCNSVPYARILQCQHWSSSHSPCAAETLFWWWSQRPKDIHILSTADRLHVS